MVPITINAHTLIEGVNRLDPFVREAFDYLNGNINRNNPCRLYIDIYDMDNYAEFRKPDRVYVKLGSIINNLYTYSDDVKKSVILLCLAHELFHADQSASMIRYGVDASYMEIIEQQANYASEQFLYHNRQIIMNKFNIDVVKHISCSTKPPAIRFQGFNIEEYYINSILDVIIRNFSAVKTFNTLFRFSTVTIVFDGVPIMLKENGVLLNAIAELNHILNSYRMGKALKKFDISTDMSYSPSDDDKITLYLNTSNHRYEPIIVKPDKMIVVT